MSRIAGAVSISGPPSSSLIERLIGQLARPSWRRHRVENGIAGLAATSWRAPVAAQRREMLVAIDGTFLNREELPAAPNDAERLLILLDRQSFADALAKLNGDFAIAFWDGRARPSAWPETASVSSRSTSSNGPIYWRLHPSRGRF